MERNKQLEREGAVYFLTLIAGRKQKDDLLHALSELHVPLTNVVYGKGGAEANYLKNVFGLVPEENKVVITCLLTRGQSDAVLRMLVEKFDFDKPNTGVAFTVPVDRMPFE
jgi:hypothetical protein